MFKIPKPTVATNMLRDFTMLCGVLAGIAPAVLPIAATAQNAGVNTLPSPPQSRLMVYAEPSYHGRGLSLGRRTVDLGLVDMAGNVNSFIIQEGTWQMCTKPDFSGACRTFTQSERDLRRVGFSGRIRSVRRLD